MMNTLTVVGHLFGGMFLSIVLASAACRSSGEKDGEEAKKSVPSEVLPIETRPLLVVPFPRRKESAPTLVAITEEPLLVTCDAEVTDADAVLDLASQHYQEASFAEANACAKLATDLIPQAVEAQHLRAAALSALGRYQEAQVAFAMALLLDPEDPETLADVADFFINILPPKRRQTTMVGLEYARRGGQNVLARRRLDDGLRGRLLLLEAEALNDLNNPVLALPRAMEAMQLAPQLRHAEAEVAATLFRLLRFKESEKRFLTVLSHSPNTAIAHHMLGLMFEREGRQTDAEAHFLRARTLSPDEFFLPVILSEEEFAKEVKRAVALLPSALRAVLKQARLEYARVPELEDLRAGSPPFTPTILGLFRGLPIGVKQAGEHRVRVVVLYRVNLGRASKTRVELNLRIQKTLRHEIGHLQGYDEDELRRMGLE